MQIALEDSFHEIEQHGDEVHDYANDKKDEDIDNCEKYLFSLRETSL